MEDEKNELGNVKDRNILIKCQQCAELYSKIFKDHPGAINFMNNIGYISQVWDDLIDKDKIVNDETINKAFWMALIEIPQNPFFITFHKELTANMRNGINDWFDANLLEQSKNPHKKMLAFSLRYTLVNLIQHCAYLIGGYDWMRKISPIVRSFFLNYHKETLEDYFNSILKKEKKI